MHPTIVLVSSFEPAGDEWSAQLRAWASDEALQGGAKVAGAVGILLLGWILAKVFASFAFHLLGRTRFDNWVADRLGITALLKGRNPEDGSVVERFVAGLVFWIVMLIAVVAALDVSGLEQAAAPLRGLVETVVQALPRVGKAAIILLLAWVLARALQAGVTGLLDRLGVDRRFASTAKDGPADGSTRPVAKTAGAVAFWAIVFFGIAGAFDALEIEALAQPLRNAVDHLVSFLPRLAVAALLVAAGWMGGRVARMLVRNMLQAIGFDAIARKAQIDRLTGTTAPSDVVGTALLVFVLFQAVIAALGQLGLETLSVPLTSMMTRFWTLLPSIAVSTLVVAIGVVVGRLLRRVVSAALKNVGFDRLMARLGFDKMPDRPDHLDEYSEIVGLVVQLAVVALALAQALANLGFETWSGYVDALLGYMVKNVAVALLVVGVGLGIGNYVRDVVRSRRGDEDTGRWLGELARYAVLVFAFTMAVRQLEVAEDFVLLTFGLLFGALCLGTALAFGLGGKEVAGDVVRRRYEQAKAKMAVPPVRAAPPASATPTRPPSAPAV
jgi:hypothetical protein